MNYSMGEEDPIGKTVKIRGLNFRVLGVMKEKGASGWRNPDDQIFIPVSHRDETGFW